MVEVLTQEIVTWEEATLALSDTPLTQEGTSEVEAIPIPILSPVDEGTQAVAAGDASLAAKNSIDGDTVASILHSPYDTTIPIVIQVNTPEIQSCAKQIIIMKY